MKTHSTTQPPILLDLGDGSYHYNYNIEEVPGETELDPVSYQCDTATVWGKPTKQSIVRAIIRANYDGSEEFEIINDYHAHVLGVSENEEAVTKYEAFLQWKEEIKSMVEADLNPEFE
jgi:hypothetical protein